MINETRVATKTSTKTFVALLIIGGVLTAASAFAMATLPKSSFYKKGRTVAPGYTSSGYTAPGYSTPGYSTSGYTAPGYTPTGYSTPGYTAPGYTVPGYTTPGY